MFPKLKRKKRQMPMDETFILLRDAEFGTLATVSADGQPYGVPLSYVVMNESIYFHCARVGHKIDNITSQPKVSFTVVGKTQPIFTDDFTTYFESVIVFGEARAITDDFEKRAALVALCEKYLPEHMEKADESIDASFNGTAVYAVSIDHITGKAKR